MLCGLGCQTQSDHQPCALSSDQEISYDLDQMLCVQVDMHPRAFSQLGNQFRFGRNANEQFSGVIGHISSSCTEPFPDPYTYFPADVRVDGFEVLNVGIRKKGFVGSTLGGSEERPSLKIKSNAFVDGQLIGDIEKITLNNNLTDPTRMRTCLTYYVFREAGYPASNCNLANVMVNGQSLGAYTHVEHVKDDFLMREFGNDDGSLYEITIVDFTDGHLADGIGRWEPKTAATSLDNTLLMGVAEALLVDDSELEEALAAVIDLDMFIRFWALETLLGHADGYTANSNNSFVYFDPERDDRAVFIPWGPDDAMQGNELTADTSPAGEEEEDFLAEDNYFVNGAISRRISRHPDLSQQYFDELEWLLESVWNEQDLLEVQSQFTAQIQQVEANTEVFQTETAALEEWILQRRSTIEQYIESGGVEGETGEISCYEDLEGMDEAGELVTTVSHSCASASSSARITCLLFCCVALLRRESNKEDI